MVLVISEAVSTSEKLNGKNKKLSTKEQYIEYNKAVHAWLGLICCLLRQSEFYSSRAQIGKGKIFTYNVMENCRFLLI